MARLFMLLIGCTPAGRHIEQHDVFFGVGETIRDIMPDVKAFWPGEHKLHLDAWREVNYVNGHRIEVLSKDVGGQSSSQKLFFINLGGYKQNEFEEFHYKMLIAAADKGVAISMAKDTAFFRHTGFEGANSHVDDKYGIDVDDVYEISDILPVGVKEKYRVEVTTDNSRIEDEIHLGYFKLAIFE